MKEFIEIPFGAKDSELGGWEYTIPEGYTASIENGKIIVKKEDTDEDIKSCIAMCLTDANEQRFKDYGTNLKDCIAWLKSLKERMKR